MKNNELLSHLLNLTFSLNNIKQKVDLLEENKVPSSGNDVNSLKEKLIEIEASLQKETAYFENRLSTIEEILLQIMNREQSNSILHDDNLLLNSTSLIEKEM